MAAGKERRRFLQASLGTDSLLAMTVSQEIVLSRLTVSRARQSTLRRLPDRGTFLLVTFSMAARLSCM
jgi:hypothetical protein